MAAYGQLLRVGVAGELTKDEGPGRIRRPSSILVTRHWSFVTRLQKGSTMRILFITGEYPAMQGGVGDYTRRLSQALGALGADVHVLTACGRGRRSPARAGRGLRADRLSGAGAHGLATVGRDARTSCRQLRPDVVHIQYQSAAYGLHPAVNYLPWRLRALPASAALS